MAYPKRSKDGRRRGSSAEDCRRIWGLPQMSTGDMRNAVSYTHLSILSHGVPMDMARMMVATRILVTGWIFHFEMKSIISKIPVSYTHLEEGVLPSLPLGMGSAVGVLGEAGNGAKTPRIPVCFRRRCPCPAIAGRLSREGFCKRQTGSPFARAIQMCIRDSSYINPLWLLYDQ